jgi:hypothetical protein
MGKEKNWKLKWYFETIFDKYLVIDMQFPEKIMLCVFFGAENKLTQVD